ncbi:Wzz/FepE/Etk N-terminal domain-containing protein, partial [Roseomonas sp. DSM 102946]|nr:Wzz/FepE/Etk N-terminal domain-containing protein [Roseomonas sp. DSM 102946]
MNMLPSSNQPQNVRAEIVQNAPREMSIGMVMQSIWRHRFFMLVWLILVVGLASLVIFNLQASYRSTALVALDTRQIRFTEVSATLANPSAPMDSNVVRTEVEILNSDAVAREVVKDLDLVNDPEFLPQPSLLTRIASRIPFLAGILPAAEEEKPVDADTRLAQVVNAYRNRLTIFNDGRSYVISVSFEASSPADAARIANRHAEVYIARQRAVKDQALASATSWLDREVATLSDRLSQSERAIQAYRERNGLLSLGGGVGGGNRAGSTLAQQQLADVAAQLAQARADLASREARLRQSRDPSTAGSVTEVVNSDALSRLRDAEVQA